MTRQLAIIAILVLAGPAAAAQSLIPTPYPSSVGSGQPLNPEPPEPGRQDLVRDPYPDTPGAASQGNPPISRAHRRQRPVPTINERKYRVDRH